MEGIERREKAGPDAEGDEGLRDLAGDEARFSDSREVYGAFGIEEVLGEG